MTARIDPDGTVTHHPGASPSRLAAAELDHRSVVVCGHPALHTEPYVMVLDDFGAQDQPINRKAWALYGRSPIYGTVFVGSDRDGQVPAELVAAWQQPLAEWELPEGVLDVLNSDPPRPEMLARREDAR